VGPAGPQGPAGAAGADGAPGLPGAAGAPGAPGAAGETGATGPQGPKGLNWRGDWDGLAEYHADDAVAYDGSSWIALRTTTGATPAAGPNWSIAAAKGQIGDTGAQGAKGDTGAQGPAGSPGATGAQGLPGLQGIQGPQGTPGPIGPQGPSGDAGIVSSINMGGSAIDRTGWTHIETLGDDVCHLNIPLGFAFTGFGANTTSVSVSTNGVLFLGQNCATSFLNQPLPVALSNNAAFFFFWDDMDDFGSGEFIEYATQGAAPGRVFSLYYRTRLHDTFVCGSSPITIVVTVHEGSNIVTANYQDVPACARLRGSHATFGIQSAGGSSHVLVGFNAPLLDTAARQSISFKNQ
jgi:hypothetical protein